ncbi:MAG: cell division protein ZapE [Gammaproteobacteria bacterium]
MKPSQIHEDLVSNEKLIDDSAQKKLLVELDRLQEKVTIRSRSWFTKKPLDGLYIYGSVGSGKTQLMDIFFQSLETSNKVRLHFHRFMQNLHNDMNRMTRQEDPIKRIVEKLAREADVLCFDEFFVEDIGDAMMLARFLDRLFEVGIPLVATSNIHPEFLYEGGLHRDRFYPAIESIKKHCQIYELKTSQDYRLRNLEQEKIQLISGSKETDEILSKHFNSLAQGEIKLAQTIEILGRNINTKKLSQGVAWFYFNEICEGPRSSKDYIEISKEFHTLLISDIPHLTESKENETRRFIALIDECYERKVNLIISSEKNIKEIYSGSKLLKPIERALSRLEEMKSREFLSLPHLS